MDYKKRIIEIVSGIENERILKDMYHFINKILRFYRLGKWGV